MKYTHGMSKTRLFGVWATMKNRCNNPKVDAYPHYGGKGIKVCDEWLDFITFHSWAMENGYAHGMTIDRLDNSKDYHPGNCRFVSWTEQGRNTSRVKINVKTAREIKKYLALGYKPKKLSELLYVSYHIVKDIKRGKTWKTT